MSKNPKSEIFDVRMDEPGLRFVRLNVNGETIVNVTLRRYKDGTLDLNVFESANDDTEFGNTYPEFFPEVTA